MDIEKIDGVDFERMLKAGLKNIHSHEIEVNDMNVFPVPDGDTGTNLRMTLQNGVANSKSNSKLGEYLANIKKGMLLGARGNSGVILSQFFSGFATVLENVDSADSSLLVKAFVASYKSAYKSVINPVEGTVLTVAREGAEKLLSRIESLKNINDVFDLYISQMSDSLLKTPDLLPVLKESGVFDSGACGYIYIIKGMLKGLLNEEIDDKNPMEDLDRIDKKNNPDSNILDSSKFNRDSKFEDGYCTEFILQLLTNEKYDQNFSIDDFIDKLKSLGESLEAFQTDDRVKVHIHTLRPSLVIEYAQRYGEFVVFKMENMQIQHNEHDFQILKNSKKIPHKKQAVIAVVNGEGLKDLYSSFDCDIILDGGATMNTSAQEFVDAFDQVDAEKIVVLPNNKNIFLAAKQAVELSGKNNIEIIESENPVEGYYALAMSQVDASTENQIEIMKTGIENVDVLSVTFASKSYAQENTRCEKDDFIVLLNGKLVAGGKDFCRTISSAIRSLPDYKSKENCMIVVGKNVDDELTENLICSIGELLPEIEINAVEGGQEIFQFMIGF